MANLFSRKIAKYAAVVGLTVSVFFAAFGPVVQPVSQTKRVQAQSVTSALGEGLGKGLGQCLGNVLTQYAIPQTIGKVAGLLSVSLPGPFGDAGSQIAQGQASFTKFLNKSCLDPIAFFAAKSTLDQLADDTVEWVNSGFRKFGRPGNKGFVGDLDGFLAGVKDAGLNRFLQSVRVTGPGNPLSGVCKPFQPKVVRSVVDRYYARNKTPSGVQPKLTASTSVAASTCENLSQALGTTSVRSFVSGNFDAGGWAAFQHTLENPGASPVSAFMAQNQRIRNKLKQVTNTKKGEIQRQKGFLSVKTCSGKGRLSTSTNRCVVEKNGNTVVKGKPEVTTPGAVVEKQLNQVISSGQRQLELADEFNEIVAGLTDQLIGKITGTGAEKGRGGVFSQAAQRASISGNPGTGSGQSENRGYESGFAGEFASSTVAKQLKKAKKLRSLVRSLPSTNALASTTAKAKQCIKSGKFDSPGKVKTVQKLISTVNSLESAVFPPASGTRKTENKQEILQQAREKRNQDDSSNSSQDESGLTKIDWVGNKLDWEYGKSRRLDECDSFSHAYRMSYVPDRTSGRWEPYICVPAGGSQFNEKSSQFDGNFIPLPKYMQLTASTSSDKIENNLTDDGVGVDLGMNLSLYRTESRQGKVKIDWTGAEFDWKHYYPLVNFPDWPKEDTIAPQKDNWHSDKTFIKTGSVDTPGPGIQDGEAEKMDQIGSRDREDNRYGTQVCDNRNLGDNSFIVQPHDDVWTIQKCVLIKKPNNGSKIPEGHHYRFIDIKRLIDIIKKTNNEEPSVSPVMIAKNGAGFVPADDVSDIKNATSTSQIIIDYIQNKKRPKAFKEIKKQPNSFGNYLTSIINLIGDNSTGEKPENQFTAPRGETDNLRELLHDFNDLQSTTAQIANRKQLLDQRFGLIKNRYVWTDDGDIAAAQAAQKELTVSPNTNSTSTLEQLRAINKNYNCKLPSGWKPPISGGSGDGSDNGDDDGNNGDGNDDGSTTIINSFTVNRLGSTRQKRIRVLWNTNAGQCTASSTPKQPNWSGSLQNPGNGSTVIRSQKSIRFTLRCTKNGKTAKIIRNVGRSDISPRDQNPFFNR